MQKGAIIAAKTKSKILFKFMIYFLILMAKEINNSEFLLIFINNLRATFTHKSLLININKSLSVELKFISFNILSEFFNARF